MKHAERYCPFCKTSDYTLLDEFHAEVFCEKCGSVLPGPNNRKLIVELEIKAKMKEKRFNDYLNKKHFGETSKREK